MENLGITMRSNDARAKLDWQPISLKGRRDHRREAACDAGHPGHSGIRQPQGAGPTLQAIPISNPSHRNHEIVPDCPDFGPAKASFQPTWLIAKSGERTLVADHVLIGEIWVCAGQSNMDWVGFNRKGRESASADAPGLRYVAWDDSWYFTDGYAAAPVCSPTRAAIMTGLSPARVQITNPGSGGGAGQVRQAQRGMV